jgi:uncharacterized protein (UPF0332 family)
MDRNMTEGEKRIIGSRLAQARESLEEAKTLLVQDAEVNFVMNSLYYAFLYPILGLLQARGISAPMQSMAISLFEQEFIEKGDFDKRFLDAIQMAFDLRPACSCEGKKKALPQDIEQLLPIAGDFIEAVQRTVG